jgi:hypothetical protein
MGKKDKDRDQCSRVFEWQPTTYGDSVARPPASRVQEQAQVGAPTAFLLGLHLSSQTTTVRRTPGRT